MIVLISPEQTLDTEIDILHQLFEAGLAYYHVRKPKASFAQHKEYLLQVDRKFHKHIITHNFHKELCNAFDLKGIHLEEAAWRAQGESLKEYASFYQEKGMSVSSSYHEPEDLAAQSIAYNYTILSPVFSAISRSGMEGRGFNVRHIDKNIVGMGGINAQTTPAAVELGFKGVGALGGVWNAGHPVKAFTGIRDAFAKAI